MKNNIYLEQGIQTLGVKKQKEKEYAMHIIKISLKSI